MLGIFFDSAKTSNFLAESFNGSTCFGFVMISCDLVQAPADWEHFIEKMLYIFKKSYYLIMAVSLKDVRLMQAVLCILPSPIQAQKLP